MLHSIRTPHESLLRAPARPGGQKKGDGNGDDDDDDVVFFVLLTLISIMICLIDNHQIIYKDSAKLIDDNFG